VVDESHSLLPRDTQASLANYQYHLDTQSNPRVLAANSAISVRSLEFLLVQPIDFSNADRLLGYTTSVDNVAISIDKYAAAVRMNMTTNDMFNALFHATEGIPSRRLRLQGITFEADDLPAVLPLGRVEYLHMIDCENIGHFHANFSARRLTKDSRRDESSNFHTVGARPDGHSSDFITPLRTFHIMSSRPARRTFFYPVSWLSLCEHASELECLGTDDGTPICPDSSPLPSGPTPMLGFGAFCQNASRLEQLSIHSPGIEPEHWDSADGLNGMLVSLTNITYPL
jgi:hypothetical protein